MNEEIIKSTFMSIPMNGRTKEDIANEYEKIKSNLAKNGYKVINTLFFDEYDRMLVFTSSNQPDDRTPSIPAR